MAEQKFRTGDRVQMTADTRAMNEYAKSHIGVVINYSKVYPDHIRLRRDGLTTIELWHESAWEQLEGAIKHDGE